MKTSPSPAAATPGESRADWQAGGLSLMLLLAGLTITVFMARSTQAVVAAAEERAFEFSCSEIQHKILDRLKACEAILRSAAAFYDRSGHVSREDWRRFVELQQIDRQFPGIQGVGFALLIPREELARHLEAIRAEGYPVYRVRPEGDRALYSSIIYLEPFSDRNLRAFGYDMLTEPIRAAAMVRARDQNAAALTGKVTLVQETNRDVQAGTLMYVPVYRRDRPIAAPAERQAAFIGWVYSPYRMADLMRGTMEGRNLSDDRRVRLEVYDGEHPVGTRLLYDSLAPGEAVKMAPDLPQGQRSILSAGRPWTLRFTRLGSAPSALFDGKVGLVLFAGTSTSLFLSGLLFSLLNTRRRAERLASRLTQELRTSEEKFRAIADYTVGWETWFGLEGNILWVNPGVQRITGYAPAEVLALPDFCATMIVPEDRARFGALARGAVQGGQGDDMEFQCIRKDGTRYWLSVSWQPIFDRRGQSLGLRASGRDITALKQAEAKLRLANWVLEQASTSIMITDHQGTIEYVNMEFTRATGYRKEEAIGKNPRFLKSGRTNPEVYADLWGNLSQGRSWQGELLNRKKNGELYWESLAISPLRDADGRVQHHVCIKQDVTEHKRLQLALQESLANFRTFFESITDMIFVGQPDGRLIFTNQAVTQTLGYTKQELLTMHVLDVHPADRRREAEQIFSAMFRGERASCPLPLAAKDGALVPVNTRVWFGQWNGENCLFGISKNLSAEEEAQQRFERLFRHNPSLMALSTYPERRFYDANEAFLQALGFSLGDVIGRTTEELGLFPDTAQQRAAAEKLTREGRIANIELPVRRRDGSSLVGLFSGEVIRSQGKQYFLTVMNDISELKRMQGALKESNDRLFLAARAGGVGIWDYDVANNRLSWDDQMLRLYGITRESFPGTYDAWQSRLHPGDQSRGEEEIQRALQGEKTFDTEFRVVWPDGSVHDIRAMALVQRDGDGRPVRLIGTNWDITAERQVAKALSWNQELLQLMAASSPLGFLVVDNHTDAILYCNERFCEIWGITDLMERLRRGELKYQQILPACLPQLVDGPGFVATCAALRDVTNRATLEDEIAFTGRRTIRRFTTQVRDQADRYFGRFYIYEDISERKRREAETAAMLAREREVSEMKTRFIAVTSHEFRTPMTAAVASVELLVNHFDRLAPAKRQELLARVNVSMRRMTAMLDEILLLNRLEQNRVEVKLTTVELRASLHDLIEEARVADRDAHRFEFLAPAEPIVVRTDPNLCHHIYSNLLSNAVRYSPAGTIVTVRLAAEAGRVEVAVEDQGIGVPLDDRARIFEPFERGSNVGSIKGTGLGLNIVKRMTEMLGGTIAVESPATPGTRFVLVFPAPEAIPAKP